MLDPVRDNPEIRAAYREVAAMVAAAYALNGTDDADADRAEKWLNLAFELTGPPPAMADA